MTSPMNKTKFLSFQIVSTKSYVQKYAHKRLSWFRALFLVKKGEINIQLCSGFTMFETQKIWKEGFKSPLAYKGR